MGVMVEEALQKAVTAVENRDTGLSRAVIDGDLEIDQLQLELEENGAQLLATEQPVATNLREILVTIKIASDLERIGDHARHLARLAFEEPSDLVNRVLPMMRKMTEVGIGMVHDSLSAFVDQNADNAKEVAARDDKIDEMHHQLYREIVGAMREHPDWVEVGTNLVFLNRFLERLGDHVTNICEWIVYARTGDHVDLNKPQNAR
jgi:phosphate transport system protein